MSIEKTDERISRLLELATRHKNTDFNALRELLNISSRIQPQNPRPNSNSASSQQPSNNNPGTEEKKGNDLHKKASPSNEERAVKWDEVARQVPAEQKIPAKIRTESLVSIPQDLDLLPTDTITKLLGLPKATPYTPPENKKVQTATKLGNSLKKPLSSYEKSQKQMNEALEKGRFIPPAHQEAQTETAIKPSNRKLLDLLLEKDYEALLQILRSTLKKEGTLTPPVHQETQTETAIKPSNRKLLDLLLEGNNKTEALLQALDGKVRILIEQAYKKELDVRQETPGQTSTSSFTLLDMPIPAEGPKFHYIQSNAMPTPTSETTASGYTPNFSFSNAQKNSGTTAEPMPSKEDDLIDDLYEGTPPSSPTK